MKNLFPGYFPLSADELETLWRESIFVLDTNVLLHLYGYSEATREQLLKLFDSKKAQLFIPYNVCHEFLRNRVKVIQDEVSRYDMTSSSLREVVDALKSDNRHPFVDIELTNEFIAIAARLETAIQEGKKGCDATKKIDRLRDRICLLVEGRIGDPLSESELDVIYKVGKARYENQVPPGYLDAKKPEPQRYGDLVIWMNMIKESKERKKSVVFITDEDKDDWWLNYEKKKFSPRPELIHEFKKETSKDIWIYSTERFVEIEKNRTQHPGLDSVVQELEAASQERSYSSPMSDWESLVELFRVGPKTDWFGPLLHRLHALEEERKALRVRRQELKEQLSTSGSIALDQLSKENRDSFFQAYSKQRIALRQTEDKLSNVESEVAEIHQSLNDHSDIGH